MKDPMNRHDNPYRTEVGGQPRRKIMTTLKDVETHLATLRNHAAREHDNLRASLPKLWRPEEIANAALKLRECEAKVGAYNDALTAIGLVTGTEASS